MLLIFAPDIRVGHKCLLNLHRAVLPRSIAPRFIAKLAYRQNSRLFRFPPLQIPRYTAKLSYRHPPQLFRHKSRKTNSNSPVSTAHTIFWQLCIDLQSWQMQNKSHVHFTGNCNALSLCKSNTPNPCKCNASSVCAFFYHCLYRAPSVYRPPFSRLSPKFSSVPISPVKNTPLYCQTQLPPFATGFQTQKS